MKIGCHCVLFANRIVTDTERILSELSQAGSEGVEIGSRFYGNDKNQELKFLLERYQIELAGLHANFVLSELIDNPELAESILFSASRFLTIFPNRNVIFTGQLEKKAYDLPGFGDERLVQPESLRQMAQALNAIAIKMKEQFGVQLNYHNHDWEFLNDAAIFNALVEYAPDVNFALDIGWAGSVGAKPMQILEALRKRIHYTHLRDFVKEDVQTYKTFEERHNGFVNIGEGDSDIAGIVTLLKSQLLENDWLIIEYEKGEAETQRYKRALDYIKAI